MADGIDLLSLILEKAGSSEPVSVVRRISGDGESAVNVFWRGEFSPPFEQGLADSIRERLTALELKGGIADLFSLSDKDGNELQVVLEIVRPKLRLLVFGAGHVGQAVSLLGAMLGYQVVVIDDRREFLSRRRFSDPRIELLVHDVEGAANAAGVSARTAVIIVTRGHQSDEACLRSVVRSNAFYVGMIGSRRRVTSVYKRLMSDGFTESELGRIHAPIGLRIGARTPQEIAVSILAEVIDCVNNPKPQQRGMNDGV